MRKTYIRCGWIITMNDENTVIRDGCIEISGKWLHRIHTDTINIFPKEDIVVIDAPHMVALPGLIDIHTHVCGNLFKGLLEDARDGFYSLALPMEKRLTPEFVYSLSLSGAAECLMGGITMVNDMYHCALSTAQAIDDLGMRGVVAGKIYEADLTRLPVSYTHLCIRNAQSHQRHAQRDQIRIAVVSLDDPQQHPIQTTK